MPQPKKNNFFFDPGPLRVVGFLAVLIAVPLGAAPGAFTLIPAERLTEWNPGIPGGIPARKKICATVEASTYGNGSQDATAGIQAALQACPAGQVVQLSAGDFKITSPLQITKGIVLRGLGPEKTRLKMPVGTNANLITVGTQWFKLVQTTNLASDAVKGSRTAVLAKNPGLTGGEIVAIDQLTNPGITEWGSKSPPGDPSRTWFTRPDRPVGQVMEVQSVSGNKVTFTTPFHIDFQTKYEAQLSRFANFENGPVVPSVKYAGIEDLYVYGGSGGQGNIWFTNAAYSWIRNVESDYQNGSSISLHASFRCVVRDSYVHSTQSPAPGGSGYGFSLSMYSADNLLENNISWNMNKVMVMRATGGGNVIAYNYMDDGWIHTTPGWVEVGLNASHLTCPHYELFEGNEAFNFDGDNTWGNSVYITVFRNHLTAKRRSAPPLHLKDEQNVRAIGLMEGHKWYSFVGNVLGTAGQDPSPAKGYVYEAPFPWTDTRAGLWRLGYNPENWKAPPDKNVTGTILREGNFDYATNQVHWDKGPQELPPSLYLKSKPDFFGNDPWPWVDAVGTVKLYKLPARARFDAMKRP
jgi:Pectate lyase superfamily protein